MIPTLNDDRQRRESLRWILIIWGRMCRAFHCVSPGLQAARQATNPAKTLDHARQIALDVGLRYVYEGNIYSEGANTYCPKCEELLIRVPGMMFWRIASRMALA